ncbi:hypothetical protein [Streptomyces sp. NPDC053431]|uniref:hypothetical protein n=1 Tax=Streptomyces sp. NPDC053431 TaxID=3365703 RepID=UPI0037D52CFB
MIDGILTADLTAPRKQRHTVKRIFDRLLDERVADVSYQMVRGYGRWPPRGDPAGGPARVWSTRVPQTHRPGAEAEVDFGDVTVKLAGELVACYLFACRVSYSGKAVHRLFTLRLGGAGGVLRGPRPRSQRAGRSADPEGPLRQP